MAWLQKRPQVSDPTMFYSVGLNITKLIVGLGNPGKEYDLTRHNIGFYALDYFVDKSDDMDNWVAKKNLKCLISTGTIGSSRVIAIKPTTFMNLSGEAVQAVMNFYKIQSDNVVAVHDELDIKFGQIRSRSGGSDAGHNGIKSVTSHIGEDFGRVRIGIGPKTANLKSEDFVLKKFTPKQLEELPNLAKETNALLSEFIYGSELPQDTRSFIF